MLRYSLFALGFLVAGCGGPVTVDPTASQTVATGFVPFASFRGADGPGTVYRVTPDGDIRRVTLLNVEVHQDAEVTYDISATREFTAQQLLKLTSGDCTSVNQGFNPQLRGAVTVSSVNGIREYTYDDQVDRQISALRHAFETGQLTYRPTDQYWIIRETLKTDTINYSETSGWVVEANASADLQACAERLTAAEGSASVNLSEGNSLTLNRTFPEPLRGWYMADRLTVELPFGAAEGTAPNISIAEDQEGQELVITEDVQDDT